MRGDGVVRMRDDDETCANTNTTSETTKIPRIANTHTLLIFERPIIPHPITCLSSITGATHGPTNTQKPRLTRLFWKHLHYWRRGALASFFFVARAAQLGGGE
jgi:hypothetical protein